jgi:mono/diheme cytochrome c family protein
MRVPFSNHITPATRDAWILIRRHRVLAIALVAAAIAFVVFAAYIGFAQMAVLLIPVVVATFVLLRRRSRKSADTGRAEAIAALSYVALSSVAVFALIQAIPYGRSHSNPPVTGEPQWDSARTRELTVRACYGCHSNEVEYPSYANIAPISWMVQSHVDEGRDELNFSIFDQSTHGADDAVETILDGSMPPSYYTRFGLHPEARLTDAEIQELVAGLKATFAKSGISEKGYGDKGKDHDDDDD